MGRLCTGPISHSWRLDIPIQGAAVWPFSRAECRSGAYFKLHDVTFSRRIWGIDISSHGLPPPVGMRLSPRTRAARERVG